MAKGINPEGYSVESDLPVLNVNLRNFQKRGVISLGAVGDPAKIADRLLVSVEWRSPQLSHDGKVISGRGSRRVMTEIAVARPVL